MSDLSSSPLAATATCPHQAICSTLPPQAHFHAVASYSGLAALRAVTINHRNAGLAGLQHLSLGSDGAMALHGEVTRRGIESVVLTTCNRTELYWRARVPGDDETATAAFGEALGVRDLPLTRAASRLAGDAAAAHLFRVCCGLESVVLGEAEILGQVRQALEAAPGAGTFLTGVFKAALRTGRIARTETAIGAGAMSVVSTGVAWLLDRMPLDGRRVLIVGAGETGARTVRQLVSAGARDLVIANRTIARARALAAPLGARAVGLSALREELAAADAVVCAASAPDWLITRDDVGAAAAGRSAPLFIVDLAMPSAVEPGDVPGVARIALQDLESLVDRHRQHRQAEVPGVEAVIARELEWLRAWARHEAMRPLVSGLRRKVEAIRRSELARAERELAGAGDASVLDRLSRRLLDRVLAIPLAQLEAGDLPLDAAHAEYLRRLFALQELAPGPAASARQDPDRPVPAALAEPVA